MSRTSRRAPGDSVAVSSVLDGPRVELSIAGEGDGERLAAGHDDRHSDAAGDPAWMRSRPGAPPIDAASPRVAASHGPSAGDRALMARLAIHLEGGRYRFAGYRWDRLDDAVRYVELRLRSRAAIAGDAGDPRLQALRDALPGAVDLLKRCRASEIAGNEIDDYVALQWLQWNAGGLQLTHTGERICRQQVDRLG